MLFRKLVYSAFLVGIITGSLYGLYQQLVVNPVIYAAEQYEVEKPESSTQLSENGENSNDDGQRHTHDHDAWGPEDGFQRVIATLGSNILIAIAFALILLSAMIMHNLKSSRPKIKPEHGLFWGLAMLSAFYAAPALLGLHPEVPGTEAAALENRQVWWMTCVITTALGLALLYYGNVIVKLAGIALVLLPHLIAAPKPAEHGFANSEPAAVAALEQLTSQFLVRTSIGMIIFYVLLGLLSAWACQRFFKHL